MDAPTELRPGSGSPPPRIEIDFTPGMLVADRYRIVALLGRGGAGEVYRADDLKLGQPVALKHIPPHRIIDANVLQRCYNEVRIGRQVAHPNVCRIYDLVEAGSFRFIAMEYVDGEDLSSLLRRIGRLPHDKALGVARDVCAGLAAAHDRGFIHRDLKPENIMIDGRGSARITDFGLAVLAGEADGECAGTPPFMAPEQFRGERASARSDIYALGLVLFEMFTGRRAISGSSFNEIREQHEQPKPRASSFLRDIDPAVDRIIARCMEEDSRARPASVREILAALPGADRLDAAIAAGETPSPQMVAASSVIGDLTPARGWKLFGSLALALVLWMMAGHQATLTHLAPEIKPRDAQIDRARHIQRVLGYDDAPPRDWNAAYVRDYALLHSAVAIDGMPALALAADWMRRFEYRDSPQPLVARNTEGRVNANDPPFTIEGMTTIVLDGRGRLREFKRLRPSRGEVIAAPVDWTNAFREAELDPALFHSVTPSALPPVGADARYAWTGTLNGRTINVDAASAHGRAAWFAVHPPWDHVSGSFVEIAGTGASLAVFYLLATVVGAVFARRNVVRGRADMRGAWRLAGLAAVVRFAALLFGADHVGDVRYEWWMIAGFIGASLYHGFVLWLCHLAIEPYVRRRWPSMLVSASRLLSGRIRDPLVGSDLLRGLIAGTVGVAAWKAGEAVFVRLGMYVPLESAVNIYAARPFGTSLLFANGIALSLLTSFSALTLLVLARKIVGNDLGAFAALWLILTIAADDQGGSFVVDRVISAVLLLPAVYVAKRFGALAFMTAMATTYVLCFAPVSVELSRWYGMECLSVALLTAAAGAYAFHTALAGKPLFGTLPVEDEAAA